MHAIGLAVCAAFGLPLTFAALAPVRVPTPESLGAVLVTQASSRSQGSVWIETPETTDPDPAEPITLSFYASFETAGPNQQPEALSSGQLLENFHVRYVLAGRLAAALETCDPDAHKSAPVSYQDLELDQRYMAVAMVAAARGERVSDRNRDNVGDVVRAERESYVVLTPLEAESSSWVKVVDGQDVKQPTAIMHFTCRFRPEAFWVEQDGVALFLIPGIHSLLRAESGRSATVQEGTNVQRLQRGFLLKNTSKSQQFQVWRWTLEPRRNPDQTDAFVSIESSTNQIDFAPEGAAFTDTNAAAVRNFLLLLAGVLAGLFATIAWDLVKSLVGRQETPRRLLDHQ